MKRTMSKQKSRKIQIRKLFRTTRRYGRPNKCSKSSIVEYFIGMLNTVKLYHWNTRSFSQHKATDELYENLNDHVDKFVEVLLGKSEATSGKSEATSGKSEATFGKKESRFKNLSSHIPLDNKRNLPDFKTKIYQYRDYLINMNHCLDGQKDSDLLNIRDEILGDINQFLYLLTFDK